MASLNVHAPDGKTLTVQVPEGTDPSHYGALADDALSHYSSTQQMGGNPPLGEVAKQVFNMMPIAHPVRNAVAALPIAGGAVGGPIGAATGEFAREAANTVLDPSQVPETALGRFASTIGAGVMQEPKILNAIPGIPQVGEMVSNLASKTGKGMAKAAQALSGGKAGDFLETAKKGFLTYAAKSKEEAGAAMGKVIEKLPGKSAVPTMAENIASAITPESSAGNKFLVDMGKRIDGGELINARDALKAKQSLDDVIDTVPIWQTKRRAKLFDLKSTFDDVLSNQSGELKSASNDYRAAVLKDNMTKFLPVNKHGEYSRLAPMMASLASTVGIGAGAHKGGAEGSVLGGLAPLAGMVALSPGSLGAGAASLGAAKQAINAIGQNPAARQVLLQVLQKLTQNKKSQ